MDRDENSLIEFGAAIRMRRKVRGFTLRDLAEQAGVSTSYLSSVERAVNPSTGRPPQISARFAERLRQILGLGDISTHVSNAAGEVRSSCSGHACEHILLIRLDEGRGDLASYTRDLTTGTISDWICVADPAAPEAAKDSPNFHGWSWSFGSDPYPGEFLDPHSIVAALERKASDLALDLDGRSYGLVIADCSTIMRWVINPDAEVNFEEQWCDLSGGALTRSFGHAPSANVCVYHQSDLEVLAARVDVLDTLLQLIEAHGRVAAVLPDGSLAQGTAAIMAILNENRPTGISGSAWRTLCKAVAYAATSGTALHKNHYM